MADFRQKENNEERVEYETIKSFEKKYGTKNFIEIALKKIAGGADQFISLAKGYYDANGNKRYKKSFGFAYDEEMKNFVIEVIAKL